MRRMYSESELRNFIKSYVVEALVGKDISVEGISSKGIANTGGFANIGDVTISGDLLVQGEDKGKIKGNTLESVNPLYERNINFPETSGNFSIEPIYTKVIQWNHTLRIVISVKVTNTGETSANVPNIYPSRFTIPTSVGSKVYDVDGNSVVDNPTVADTEILIRGCMGSIQDYSGANFQHFNLAFGRYNNNVAISLRFPTISVSAGASKYIFAELSLNI